MRLFNLRVYKGTQYGTTATYSASEFDGVLGSAERLAVHCRVWRASGTTPKLTVNLEESNDGANWVPKTTALVNQETLSTTGETALMAVATKATMSGAAFVRLAVSLFGSDNVADVQIIVCGRGEQRAP